MNMKHWRRSVALCVLLVPLSVGLAEAKHGKRNGQHHGMDRNGNGVITRGEWRGNDRSFANHDRNGDGVLSGDETRSDGQTIMIGTDRFNRLDGNRNGYVTQDEWDNTVRSFDLLDQNGDGRLSRNEFFNRRQYSISVFRELDQNNDGRIARGEWRSSSDAFNRVDTNRDELLSENEFNSRRGISIVEWVFQDVFGIR